MGSEKQAKQKMAEAGKGRLGMTYEERYNDRLTPTDIKTINAGFDHGNYFATYTSEDWAVAEKELNGTNGFYRAGFLLGFYSSFALHEIPSPQRGWVEHEQENFPWLREI